MEWHTGNPSQITRAIKEFETALPGWWWSIGSCSVSGHASCGPDSAGPDAELLDLEDRIFDSGFHQDYTIGTAADALRDVMKQALAAKGKLSHDHQMANKSSRTR